MITRKQNTCCFNSTKDANLLEVKNPQDTLRNSVCDTCWTSIISDTFHQDTKMIKDLSVHLSLTYRHINKDVIEDIASMAYAKVYKNMERFECTLVELVGTYKIPTKLKSFAQTTARNLMINYFKSPKFEMYRRTKQMRLKNPMESSMDTDEAEYDEQVDTEQKMADELCFLAQRKDFFMQEIELIKSQLTTRNKALRQAIIDLYVYHYLKNSEIFAKIKKDKHNLIPSQMTDKKLSSLVVNTLSQFRNELKANVKKF